MTNHTRDKKMPLYSSTYIFATHGFLVTFLNANKAVATAAATGNIEIRMLSCGPLSEFRFVCTCEALASVLTTELFRDIFNSGMFFICLIFLTNVVRLIELIHKSRSLRPNGMAKIAF